MATKSKSIIMALIFLLAFSTWLQAATPTTVQLSAQLFEDGDGFSYEGEVLVELSRLIGEAGVLWSESFEDVALVDGWFYVELGSTGTEDPGPLADVLLAEGEEQLIFEITLVDIEYTLPGTLKITAVPYALVAQNADTLQGMEADAFAFDGHAHDWAEIENAPQSFPPDSHSHPWGQISNIPEGFDDGVDDDTTYSAKDFMGLEFDGTEIGLVTGCSSGEILKWDGSGWTCDLDQVGENAPVYSAKPDMGIEFDGELIGLIPCVEGQILKYNETDGKWECKEDLDTIYDGADFALSGQACPGGQVMTGIDISGARICSADLDSGGDITGVTAGTGLSGGGTSGDVTLDVSFAGSGSAASSARSDHEHDAAYVDEGQADSVSSTMIENGAIGLDHLADMACDEGYVLKWNDTATQWVCAVDEGLTVETDPTWTADKPSYYTKTELQGDGTAETHWNNLSNVPAGFADGSDDGLTAETDPTWTTDKPGYYTKAELQGDGTAETHWNNLTAVPAGFLDGTDDGLTAETDPTWTADKPGYYTKAELQGDGTAMAHWNNLTAVPAGFADGSDDGLTVETDPTWTTDKPGYYTKAELQGDGTAMAHWNNLTAVPAGFADGSDDGLLPSASFDGDVSGTYDNLQIGTDAVGSNEIGDGSVAFGDMGQNGCDAANNLMKWDGGAWACAADDGETYTPGTGISIASGIITNTGDTNAADDLTNTMTSGGDLSGTYDNLQIGMGAVGSNEIENGSIALGDLGQNGCTPQQLLKWGGSAWACAADDGETYTQGTGISISAGVISNTGDTNAADDLTTGTTFAGDVSGTYDNLQIGTNAVGTTEIANGAVGRNDLAGSAILFSHIGQTCSPNQIMKYSSGWTCASDDNTTYIQGTGISISAGVISNTGDTNAADDLTTGTTFSGDLSGTYNNLQIGADMVDSNEIADDAITLAHIGQNGCSTDDIMKWEGAAWGCATDSDTTYTGANFALSSQACGLGQFVTGIGSTGNPICATPSDSDTFPAPTQVPQNNSVTSLETSASYGHYSAITIGSDNLPVIAHQRQTTDGLFVTKCSDMACNAATSVQVDTATANVGSYCSITIGTDGFPVISYKEAGSALNLKVAKCNDLSCSTATINTVDSTNDVGNYSSITIGTDGYPIIAHYSTVNMGELRVTHCSDASCNSSTSSTITGGGGSWGEYASIAIGSDGFPVISLLDGYSYMLGVTKCSTVSCSSSSNVTPTSGGFYTSITIGRDGFPVISHTNSSSNALYVTKCSDHGCSSTPSTTTVESAAGTGNYSSITIGHDGLPIISYKYAVPGPSPSYNLKVAKCLTADCSSATTRILDSTADSGDYTSITIRPDGLPIISYHYITGADLMVARCANVFCIPNWTRR